MGAAAWRRCFVRSVCRSGTALARHGIRWLCRGVNGRRASGSVSGELGKSAPAPHDQFTTDAPRPAPAGGPPAHVSPSPRMSVTKRSRDCNSSLLAGSVDSSDAVSTLVRAALGGVIELRTGLPTGPDMGGRGGLVLALGTPPRARASVCPGDGLLSAQRPACAGWHSPPPPPSWPACEYLVAPVSRAPLWRAAV